MKLVLDFYANTNDPKPIWKFEDEIPKGRGLRGKASPEGRLIKWGRTDTIWVEARIEDYGEGPIRKDLYRLQLAYDPDEKVTTDANGTFYKKEKGDDVHSVQLLRGAGGRSCLRLLMCTGGAKYENEIAHWWIDIEPPYWKRQALRRMAAELLIVNPSAVVSRMLGLSLSPIKKRYHQGDASLGTSDLDDKLDVLRWLLDAITPHLNVIRLRSSVEFRKTVVKMPCDKIRNHRQCMSSEQWRRGNEEMGRKIRVKMLCVSADIPIHCAINDFLIKLEADISNMLRRVKHALEEDDELIKIWYRRARGADAVRRLKEEHKYKSGRYEELRRLLGKCRLFRTGAYPWSGCKCKPITSIVAWDVPASTSYQNVYFLMLTFSRIRFFLLGSEGRFLVPEYRLDLETASNDMPSTWQRNYSAIYESWVFNRVVMAFTNHGFKGLETDYRVLLRRRVRDLVMGVRSNEPIHGTLAGEAMRVELMHGILAYKGGGMFSVEDDCPKDDGLTPDFAIVFTRTDGTREKFHWIVVDAKSGSRLYGRDIEKRDEYLWQIKYLGMRPDQSWLVYSGRTNCPLGIEFNKDETDNVRKYWGDDLTDKRPLGGNDILRWTATGIIGWKDNKNKDKITPVGHLRVNVVALQERGYDVFDEFAQGQVATAKTMLGINH